MTSDRNNNLTISDFKLVKKIGEGAFGSVYMAQEKSTENIYAIKYIKVAMANRSNLKGLTEEIRILSSIDHPNIVSYKSAFWDKPKTHICLAMEFMGGGDLTRIIRKHKKNKSYIPQTKIWSYTIQLLNGLQVLHELNIIHRDIKSANCFISKSKEEIKLGDMNVSKVTKGSYTKTQVGTPLYISPEIWKGKQYDNKTDIWSLGCLIYEMCTLSHPFSGKNLPELRMRILSGKYPPIPRHYDKMLSVIIKECLQVDSSLRPSATKLLDNNIIQKKMGLLPNHLKLINFEKNRSKLIDTIKIPMNIKNIKLPRKNSTKSRESLMRSNSLGEKKSNRSLTEPEEIIKKKILAKKVIEKRMRSSYMSGKMGFLPKIKKEKFKAIAQKLVSKRIDIPRIKGVPTYDKENYRTKNMTRRTPEKELDFPTRVSKKNRASVNAYFYVARKSAQQNRCRISADRIREINHYNSELKTLVYSGKK